MRNNVLDYLYEIKDVLPEKTAFSDGEYSLDFKTLYEKSAGVASYLNERHIYREPVAVFMNRHPKEVAAFFGCIMAGDFYVPIDSEMPAGRIQMILDNIDTSCIICDSETKEIAESFRTDAKIVLYDEICDTEINADALREIYDKAIDTDPIYIVFTSGSTGIPKGVCACHRSVLDYVEQLSDVLEFSGDTVFGSQTPLYFDACLKELYPTLKFGATTYLIPKPLFMTPVKLVEYLNKYSINTVCWVVSALTVISSLGTFKTIIPEYLKLIAFGSEVFPIKQFNIWRETLPEAKFVNLYGPTEGTGMCCYYKVDRAFREDEAIPVGRPFKNTEILLLDGNNERAKAGEAGEICIRGTSVTLGYYNDPERTGQVFVQNPLNKAYPELIYRTGDIGKYNEYGELVFVSRKDHQIKHMGHRIELGEIEMNVNMCDGIEACGCVYDNTKGKIILAYCGETGEKELAAALKKALPRYMVPNRIVKMDSLPHTPNGKTDRRKILELVL